MSGKKKRVKAWAWIGKKSKRIAIVNLTEFCLFEKKENAEYFGDIVNGVRERCDLIPVTITYQLPSKRKKK